MNGRLGCAAVGACAWLGLAALPAVAATPSAPSDCPTYNPPNELVLSAGTPQSARLGTAFATGLAVGVANSDGCPLTTPPAGIAVTFTAPASGPSGSFASSGSNAALVGTNEAGVAMAPPLTANTLPGGYLVTASSDYGSVSFSLVNTATGVPRTVAGLSPTRQSATVSNLYPHPLQAQVLDADGAPVAGATVSFTVASGGGNDAGAVFQGGGGQVNEQTDASGIAISPRLLANGTGGKFTATATVGGTNVAATFALENVPARPPLVAVLGSSRRSAVVGARYAEPLEVQVRTAQGAALPGATVTFTLGTGGSGAQGSAGASFVGGAPQATETTDARGIAVSPRFTAGSTAGTFTATVTVGGSQAMTSFRLDNLAGKPPTVRVLAGGGQEAATGESYAHPLAVLVRDGRGHLLQGASVTFTLGSGGGGGQGAPASAGASFVGGGSQATETTNARGVAVSPRFTAASTAGAFTATAAVSGSHAVASFHLDNLTGKPPTVRPLAGGGQRATAGASYGHPLAVLVRDGHGHPLEGATVTFTLGAESGGGQGGSASAGASFAGAAGQATETTNARGIAVSPRFTADSTAGAFTATALVGGSRAAASFQLENVAAAPTTVTAGAASSESTSVRTPFPVRLAVTVTDEHGNAVAGVEVTFSAPAAGPSGSFAGARKLRVRVKTNAHGIALAPPFSANGTAGGYAVEATVRGAPPAAFALVNQTP